MSKKLKWSSIILLLATVARADIKISDMPAASTLNLSDIIPIVQSGANKKATFTLQKSFWDTYYVPLARTITINGTTLDLSANRSWTISTANANLHYITTQNDTGTLPNSTDLGALTTGLLKISVSAGTATPSTAVEGTDYLGTNRISDAAYGAGWDADTTHAPSKNSVYDAIQSITSGSVSGPGSSTDNAVARWDGTTGDTLQDSAVTIDDTGNMSLGTTHSLTAGTIELGAATDTTIARSSAGHVSVEGSVVGLASDTLSFFTASTTNTVGVGHIELGAASDTTVDRNAAGIIQVEGVAVPTISSTHTLTNKRLTARSGTASAPGGTPTLNTDNYDVYTFTSLGANITSMSTNLSGTPVTGDKILLGFKDDGTPRTITWGSSFQSGPATLLATTATSKQHWVGLFYDGSKWTCFAVDATGY